MSLLFISKSPVADIDPDAIAPETVKSPPTLELPSAFNAYLFVKV